MKYTPEQFFEYGKKIKLSSEEKNRIRGNLLSFVKSHPTRDSLSNWMQWQNFLYKHTVVVMIVALIFFTGTTTALAEKAFPGDSLYPVKTKINEQVLGLFARSPQSRAELQIKLAERRLSEVEYLSQSSSSPEIRNLARRNLDEQTRHAEEDVFAFAPDNNNDVGKDESISQAKSIPATAQGQGSLVVTSRGGSFNRGDANQRIKKAQDKLKTLRTAIYGNKTLKPEKRVRLKHEILLTEKAIFETRERLDSDDRNSSHKSIEEVEKSISDIENRSDDQTLEIHKAEDLKSVKVEDISNPGSLNEKKPSDSSGHDILDDSGGDSGSRGADDIPSGN
jgi:hypothetical protein